MDFTKASEKAFGRALYLKGNWNPAVVCYFIEDTSKAYFPASTRKSADRSQNRAEKQHREFIGSFDHDPDDFPCIIEAADERTSAGEKLYAAAEREAADLIIVGASGDTETETSLLGNVSETLRRMQKYIPVMIVKGEGNGRLFGRLFK